MMAADSMTIEGNVKVTCDKIIKVNGDICGVAGDLADLTKFQNWYIDQSDDLDTDESTILVLTKHGELFTYESGVRMEVKEPFYAIGTGAAAAMGAMYAGKTPKEAVKIAKKIDVNTGGKVKTYKIKSPKVTNG
jgi:ATP-dependent protease HslVU (ClpYQ) peptidase subunit